MKNKNKNKEQEEHLLEPEDYVGKAKYLLELIQMDLNFGRKESILSRSKAALESIYGLTKLYQKEEEETEIDPVDAVKYYENNGFSLETPTSVGLYSFVCQESSWEQTLVAITKNDYQIFTVHCAKVGEKSISQYTEELEFPMWKKLA
jgi:hypothetical protein